MKRIILLMLIIMLLIPMVVSCAPKDDTLGVSKSSLVEPDGWVYYFNPDGIYKIRENCENKTLVLDKTVFTFQIYKNRIYYITYKEGASTYYSIYSCKTDGSDDKLICDTPFEVYSFKRMQIVDDWFYVGIEKDVENGDENELYRVKIDGTETVKISKEEEVLWDYSIDEDWIYYITIISQEEEFGAQLWRMQHDGTNKQQVLHEFAMSIDYSETEVYYIDMDDGILYAVHYFRTEKRKIAEFDAPVFDIKVVDDWIYYNMYGSDNSGFYKIKIDGSENTKIPVETIPSINRIMVVDNWLMYYSSNFRYIEMVRIRDTYDTDSLVDYLNGEIFLKLFEEREIEVRKYE